MDWKEENGFLRPTPKGPDPRKSNPMTLPVLVIGFGLLAWVDVIAIRLSTANPLEMLVFSILGGVSTIYLFAAGAALLKNGE
jgi:hypothetical protein